MVSYLFSHFTLNGEPLASPEVNLVMTGDVDAVAYYEAPELDELHFTLGVYEARLSGVLADFYVLKTDTLEIPIRFAVLEDAVAWIQAHVVEAGGLFGFALIAGIWFAADMDKKKR